MSCNTESNKMFAQTFPAVIKIVAMYAHHLRIIKHKLARVGSVSGLAECIIVPLAPSVNHKLNKFEFSASCSFYFNNKRLDDNILI